MIETTEGWVAPQKILVILAHPDDPEFFCGASIARWTSQGHNISYCLLTRGDKGANDPTIRPDVLAGLREEEQRAAAACLGVNSVEFLNYQDGYLIPDLESRKAVTRVIRRRRPDILVTCDPQNFFPNDVRINHPDHRAAGQIALEAVFPAAGNPLFFPELLLDEGLEPHSVREVWLSLTSQPTMILDVTETWPKKLEALHRHRSQIETDLVKFDERMLNRRTPDSTPEKPRFEEQFRKLTLR